ncbi:hypothetical protein BJ138DRAFT_1112374 [Hygrophoropsis aurantiaca]|uniref:Uncharacterized protein n=1 Tax=Hygrophoropsis aurantiaca TaxID=72124 RepID=A0ACB8AHJ3_9AGAM|nr:hypothetical protein BJ138DRAFT_1112374 [Hygrophoropsis aurantiaca]
MGSPPLEYAFRSRNDTGMLPSRVYYPFRGNDLVTAQFIKARAAWGFVVNPNTIIHRPSSHHAGQQFVWSSHTSAIPSALCSPPPAVALKSFKRSGSSSSQGGTYLGSPPADILHPLPFSSYPQHSSSAAMDIRRTYYDPNATAQSYSQPSHTLHSSQYQSAPSNHVVSHGHHHSAQMHSPQFVPTPSQAYQAYSHANTVTSTSHRPRSTVDPYYHMSPNAQHTSHSHSHSPPYPTRSAHPSSAPPSVPLVSGDRYPCELCDRTFTRSHDRRRHYETVHAPVPVVHRCRYCNKDFSRADSLKRHLDNGCEERR